MRGFRWKGPQEVSDLASCSQSRVSSGARWDYSGLYPVGSGEPSPSYVLLQADNQLGVDLEKI